MCEILFVVEYLLVKIKLAQIFIVSSTARGKSYEKYTTPFTIILIEMIWIFQQENIIIIIQICHVKASSSNQWSCLRKATQAHENSMTYNLSVFQLLSKCNTQLASWIRSVHTACRISPVSLHRTGM